MELQAEGRKGKFSVMESQTCNCGIHQRQLHIFTQLKRTLHRHTCLEESPSLQALVNLDLTI